MNHVKHETIIESSHCTISKELNLCYSDVDNNIKTNSEFAAVYRVRKNKFTRFTGRETKSMRPTFKTEMSFYQSKATLDEIVFGKIPGGGGT